MYGCKECGRPVERAIEGELICSSCWARRQMSPEALLQEQEAAAYLREQKLYAEEVAVGDLIARERDFERWVAEDAHSGGRYEVPLPDSFRRPCVDFCPNLEDPMPEGLCGANPCPMDNDDEPEVVEIEEIEDYEQQIRDLFPPEEPF